MPARPRREGGAAGDRPEPGDAQIRAEERVADVVRAMLPRELRVPGKPRKPRRVIFLGDEGPEGGPDGSPEPPRHRFDPETFEEGVRLLNHSFYKRLLRWAKSEDGRDAITFFWHAMSELEGSPEFDGAEHMVGRWRGGGRYPTTEELAAGEALFRGVSKFGRAGATVVDTLYVAQIDFVASGAADFVNLALGRLSDERNPFYTEAGEPEAGFGPRGKRRQWAMNPLFHGVYHDGIPATGKAMAWNTINIPVRFYRALEEGDQDAAIREAVGAWRIWRARKAGLKAGRKLASGTSAFARELAAQLRKEFFGKHRMVLFTIQTVADKMGRAAYRALLKSIKEALEKGRNPSADPKVLAQANQLTGAELKALTAGVLRVVDSPLIPKADAPKGPIITTPGKLTPDDLAANLKGITDPTTKRIAISEYMEALKAQRVAAGKTLDYELGVTKDGGVVFYGPARGVASPVGVGGVINRNVILVTRDGKVYQMTLEGLRYVNPKLKHPIVDVDLVKGRAIELPH